MRTTSFLKAARAAVLSCSLIGGGLCGAFAEPSGNSLEDVSVISAKSVAVDENSSTQDLGLSEVSAPSVSGVAVSGTDYMEIQPSAWEGRGLSAAEILSSLSGIQSYTQGGMGSFQTVSIRGIAARNILICIDGMPLNDASGGAVDLGAIDLNNIEKIEVYKDRVPAKFGGAGIGGAINFITKNSVRAMRNPTGRVLASYGSHHSFEGSAQVIATVKDSVQFSATASMRHSDNDYEFKNRNGTLYNDNDDFKDKRRNAQFTEYSGNVQYRMLHGGGYFSTLSGNVIHTEAGNPGTEDLQTVVAKFTGDMGQFAYRLETPEYFNHLLVETGVTGKFEKNISASYYPLDKIGFLSQNYREFGLAGYRLIPDVSANLVFGQFEAFLRVSGSAEYWESRGTLQDFEVNRYTGNLAGNIEYRFFEWFSLFAEGNILKSIDDIGGGRVLMSTGMAQVNESTDRDLNMGGLVQAKFGKQDSWFGANVSVGRFFRQPQLMELYGVYAGMLSSPSLKDESALRFSAGVYLSTPQKRSLLRATYFETHAENGIYWVTSGNLMKAFNINESCIRGVELELESHPVKMFQTVLRATFQDPREEGKNMAYKGNLLPGEPVRSYFAEGTLFLPFDLSATFQMTYRTRIFSDRLNFTRQPPVTHYHASLSWLPWDKTRLVFAVNNISDETYRNIYTPYPAPGREYKFTIIQGF